MLISNPNANLESSPISPKSPLRRSSRIPENEEKREEKREKPEKKASHSQVDEFEEIMKNLSKFEESPASSNELSFEITDTDTDSSNVDDSDWETLLYKSVEYDEDELISSLNKHKISKDQLLVIYPDVFFPVVSWFPTVKKNAPKFDKLKRLAERQREKFIENQEQKEEAIITEQKAKEIHFLKLQHDRELQELVSRHKFEVARKKKVIARQTIGRSGGSSSSKLVGNEHDWTDVWQRIKESFHKESLDLKKKQLKEMQKLKVQLFKERQLREIKNQILYFMLLEMQLKERQELERGLQSGELEVKTKEVIRSFKKQRKLGEKSLPRDSRLSKTELLEVVNHHKLVLENSNDERKTIMAREHGQQMAALSEGAQGARKELEKLHTQQTAALKITFEGDNKRTRKLTKRLLGKPLDEHFQNLLNDE